MWTPVTKHKPEHAQEVLLWVVGGPLHFNEDYPAVGMYNQGSDQFVHYNDGEDLVVQVSHWQRLYPPNREHNAEKANRVKLASLPPLNPNPEEAFTTKEPAIPGLDAHERRYLAVTSAKLRQRHRSVPHQSSKRSKGSGPKGGDGVRNDLPQAD